MTLFHALINSCEKKFHSPHNHNKFGKRFRNLYKYENERANLPKNRSNALNIFHNYIYKATVLPHISFFFGFSYKTRIELHIFICLLRKPMSWEIG